MLASLALLLLAACGRAQIFDIRTLLWHPGKECFGDSACRAGATDWLNSKGLPYGRDFATVIGAEGYVPRQGFAQVVQDCPGIKMQLVYNPNRWEANLGAVEKYCLDDANPYIVLGVTSKVQSCVKAIIVALREPSYAKLAGSQGNMLWQSVRREQNRMGSQLVVLMDEVSVSRYGAYNEALLSQIGAFPYETDVASYNHLETCCANNGWKNKADRIVANYGVKMRAKALLDRNNMPAWAAGSVHLPVYGSLGLDVGKTCKEWMDFNWDNFNFDRLAEAAEAPAAGHGVMFAAAAAGAVGLAALAVFLVARVAGKAAGVEAGEEGASQRLV